MKILFVSPIFQQQNSGYHQSGGEISNRVIIEWLSERHDIYTLALVGSPGVGQARDTGPLPYAYEWLLRPGSHSLVRQMLAARELRSKLHSRVRSWKPDVILSATSTLDMAIEAGKEMGIPVVPIVRAFEHAEAGRGLYLKLRELGRKVKWGNCSAKRFSQCAAVVYNSKFLAAWYKSFANCHSPYVVYPIIDLPCDDHQVWAGNTERILMIGTSIRKGIDVTLELARMDRARTYVVAGGNPGDWAEKASSNVVFVGWQDSREKMYASIDVVIVPSRWEEPFGRVAVEALCQGKGVLVSDKGGLPEAVGGVQSLILRSLDSKEWLERLNWMESCNTESLRSVEQSRLAAKLFNPEVQLLRLESILGNSAFRSRSLTR